MTFRIEKKTNSLSVYDNVITFYFQKTALYFIIVTEKNRLLTYIEQIRANITLMKESPNYFQLEKYSTKLQILINYN